MLIGCLHPRLLLGVWYESLLVRCPKSTGRMSLPSSTCLGLPYHLNKIACEVFFKNMYSMRIGNPGTPRTVMAAKQKENAICMFKTVIKEGSPGEHKCRTKSEV